jgi:hypothetical protein
MAQPQTTRVRLHAPVSDGTTLLVERDVEHLQWIVGRWAVELFDGTLTVRPKDAAINDGRDVLKVDA